MLKKQLSKVLSFVIIMLLLFLSMCTITGCKEKYSVKNPVLLISIDGMRPDALHNTEYGKYLESVCSYSLNAKTVYPSITLPCHMSMFHSVEPADHGVIENRYTPNSELGHGIAEELSEANKKTAIFFNWSPINNVVKPGKNVYSKFVDPSQIGWEEANKKTTKACIDYITNNKVDFTFLYLGFLDEWGHAYGWLSDEYYYALNESLALVKQVISHLSDDYTVIITTDHGGKNKGHGSNSVEDMTIPIFVMGEKYIKGKNFNNGSILDIAPTVLNVLDVEIPTYWKGSPLFTD